MLGGYPDNDPGPRTWNRCPGFNNLFRNKKSVTIDLRQHRGREMLERLIKECDIFYENNVTETMEKLNISYDMLKSIRPTTSSWSACLPTAAWALTGTTGRWAYTWNR